MKSLLPALLLLCALQCPAFAQSQPFTAPDNDASTAGQREMAQTDAVDLETDDASDIHYGDENGVKYVTGGVSDGGTQAMNALQKDYSLKMMFVGTGGMYLADVGVQITGRKGEAVLNTTTTGPLLLVQLPAGTYTLSATTDGVTQTQRVVVKGQHMSSYTMRFATHES